jgi:hypothetical protein
MNQRNENEQVGVSWVFRTTGWVALVGSVLVAAPVGLVAGTTAGTWALAAVSTVALASAWLGLEAVRAWRGPVREEAAEGVLSSHS